MKIDLSEYVRLVVGEEVVIDRRENLSHHPIYKIDDRPLSSIEIAVVLDDDAENDNYHHLVGAHMWAATTMRALTNESVTRVFMMKLAEQGGFHGNHFR